MLPPLTRVSLAEGVAAALAALPAAPGVAQVLGPEGRVLVTGRPASVRRWAASQLGAGRPPRKGRRPPTDLSPVARAVGFALTSSGFQQRLLFERLMSGLVPLSARRDLKVPGLLRLDPGERFPRISVGPPGSERACLFGPFRDRAAAARARDALHKRFPLRPCDYAFEPDPELPLGLGCVYAQVRTCAAPCLARVAEDDYRALAREAAAWLAGPRSGGPPLPEWVGRLEGRRALVVDEGRAGVELYPVWNGAVLEEQARVLEPGADVAPVLEALAWREPSPPRDDLPWLSAWLHGPRRTGRLLPAQDAGRLGAGLRELLSE